MKDRQLWPDIRSGRSPQHVIFCFKVNTTWRPLRFTYNPHSLPPPYETYAGASFTPSILIHPFYPLYSTHFFHPASDNINLHTSHEWACTAHTVIRLAVENSEVFVLKITQPCELTVCVRKQWVSGIRENEVRGRKAKVDRKKKDEESEGNRRQSVTCILTVQPPVPVGTILLPPCGARNPSSTDPIQYLQSAFPHHHLHSSFTLSMMTQIIHHTNYIDANVYTLHNTPPAQVWLESEELQCPCVTKGFHTLPFYTLHMYSPVVRQMISQRHQMGCDLIACNEWGGKEKWHQIYLKPFTYSGACHCAVGVCFVQSLECELDVNVWMNMFF